MPKYLFTSDQRVSVLLDRIKYVATHIQSGQSLSALADKSDNNNATTLRFYYNLFEGTETCAQAVNNPVFAVRNFVLKFQFPNPRTPESLTDSINKKVFVAPFRSVVSILYLMAEQNQNHTSALSLDEILYFVFGNPKVYSNPSIDYNTIIEDIIESRNSQTNLQILIPDCVEWKQYDRQNRELMNVLCYSSPCFKLSKGIMHFYMDMPEYENDKTFIDSILSYNKFWYPTDKNDFNKATLEYISYMNTVDTPYSVVEFNIGESSTSSQPLSTLNPATLSSFNQQFLSAIRTKPFVLLAGISGTGKSRIVRELAKACWPDGDVNRTGHKPENFKMIQVRPNWHDSSEILGYVSRISEGGPEFVVGPFLQAVAEAWKNTERPYFVCLDEMNLAPVEQYFAEYLSVFESREFDGTRYVTDPIIELDDDDLLDQLISHLSSGNADLFNEFHDNGITIPPNLVVIGTVNMDETTYSFSRKVLDRAMTIEMNDVDLKAGISGNPKENDFSNVLLSETDVISPKMSVDDMIDQNPDVSDKVVDYLVDINSILAKTPFRIAFRTRNEAILYVLNMLDLRKDEASGDDAKKDEIIASALDEITMMKILSRIEGDESKISKDKLRQLKERTGQKCREKLDYMISRLDSGFTSFWE